VVEHWFSMHEDKALIPSTAKNKYPYIFIYPYIYGYINIYVCDFSGFTMFLYSGILFEKMS
jgi:hypothetical protein